MKAQTLLANSQTVAQRAESFVASVKRNLEKKIIDSLKSKIEKLDDELFELQDFSLQTNLNSGKSAMSREQVEEAFERMIEIEYEKELLKLELESKTASFNNYFGEEVKEQTN